ncbi:hypothetical protein PG995_004352 [Apiospora arundinis]
MAEEPSHKTAVSLMAKAKARERTQGKETVFFFGGRVLDTSRIESTLIRANKKARADETVGDVPTPQGVTYKTPEETTDTPKHVTIEDEDVSSEGQSMDVSSDYSNDSSSDSDGHALLNQDTDGNALVLTWEGHSRKDLQNMWRVARNHRDAGRHQKAEDGLQQVLDGMNHVLGRTNEDTVQVAYQLADLYATTARTEAAIEVLEALLRAHVHVWGYEDNRTQANTLKTVELLEAWGRHADALGILSLSKELLQASRSHRVSVSRQGRRGKGKGVSDRQASIPSLDTAGASQADISALTPPEVDRHLATLRPRIAAKDMACKNLLSAIIRRCEGHQGFHLQELRTHGEMVMLLQKLGQAEEKQYACYNALQSFYNAWSTFDWEKNEIETFDFLEAILQLAANLLKCGLGRDAKQVFRQVSDKATDVFGSDDERTVWVLITVGIVYQTHMTWDDAGEWFEEAFAAASRNDEWDEKDGIVISLQRALDNHHFSYISDEGRPFQTVFGVSGIIIRPGRLHLE